MLKNKKLFLAAVLACFVGSVGAQTSSPYSRYGYGILGDQAVGVSKALGGIGYGLRNSQSANPINPASYSRVDSLTFLFDIGVTASRARLSDGVNTQNDDNGGLDYITMLMPLSKRVGLSLGILPYSTVGYNFGSSESSSGSAGVSYIKQYEGNGGFSQIYLGLGYETPIKGLSVGANASYIFGTLEHINSLPYVGSSASYTSEQHNELQIKALKLDFGFQYEKALSKRNLLTVGGVFSPKMGANANFERRYYDLSGTTVIYGDTMTVKNADSGLPMSAGFGFTLLRDEKLLIGADVTYQKWSDVKYSKYMGDGLDESNRFNDVWRFNAGAEYVIDPYDRRYYKKIRFRGGVNYGNSYMNVKNTAGVVDGYNEYGATIGVGLPFLDRDGGNRTSYVNINFHYKKIKPKVSNMISEDYFGVSIGVNINEFWFFRRKAQ